MSASALTRSRLGVAGQSAHSRRQMGRCYDLCATASVSCMPPVRHLDERMIGYGESQSPRAGAIPTKCRRPVDHQWPSLSGIVLKLPAHKPASMAGCVLSGQYYYEVLVVCTTRITIKPYLRSQSEVSRRTEPRVAAKVLQYYRAQVFAARPMPVQMASASFRLVRQTTLWQLEM